MPILCLLALATAALLAAWAARRRGGGEKPGGEAGSPAAVYLGRQACAECHRREMELYQGSHHDLAMQEASEEAVLGDFNGASLTCFGVTSTFFKRGGKFFARTEGADGKLSDYQIQYTFGVYPLQQYLVEFSGGRYQVPGLCWDSRPREQGGQRWFHIYPNERVGPDSPLFWTKVSQNWNFMCAECHSTNLKKGYDYKTGRYQTSWSEIDVSCEACHGPGSAHLDWARAYREGKRGKEGNLGLQVSLKRNYLAEWVFKEGSPVAERSAPPPDRAQVEVCARCHARRSVLSENYVHGRPFLDTHRPSLLEESLYYADGQILDEVYEYGSFLQSKMHQKGVVCSDCHEPHSLKLHAAGNALCFRCHLEEKYGGPAHHFHKLDSPGASCIECHMPRRTYMVVDPRFDHGFRVPRPDLTLKIKAPNACNSCHADKTPRWAAEEIARRFPAGRAQAPTYGEAFYEARSGSPAADLLLVRIAADPAQPAMARATALSMLSQCSSPAAAGAMQRGLEDADPLLRSAALSALEALPPEARFALARARLEDPVRGVRIEAGRALAPIEKNKLPPEEAARLEKAVEEYIDAQMLNADHPSAHFSLGIFYLSRGRNREAESAYLEAMRLEPGFVLAYVNLADLYRLEGREAEGEKVLKKAIDLAPDFADGHQALGLLLARAGREEEAIEELGKAAELRPEDPRFAYVYGVSLNSTGQAEKALQVLERALEVHPNNQELLYALATIHRDRGAREEARNYARRLLSLAPDRPDLQELVRQVEMMQK